MFLRRYVLGQVSAETKENSGRNPEEQSLVISEKYLGRYIFRSKKKKIYIFFFLLFLFLLVLP